MPVACCKGEESGKKKLGLANVEEEEEEEEGDETAELSGEGEKKFGEDMLEREEEDEEARRDESSSDRIICDGMVEKMTSNWSIR